MKRLLTITALAAMAFNLAAADTPAVTIHTSIYEGYGDTNAFSLVVGGTVTGYIDVDCGFGPVEYELEQAVFDTTTQSVKGTIINCHVSEEGVVKIYCDEPAQIEYFNGLGSFIRTIEFAHPEALSVLNLEHNELESLDLSEMTSLQALYISDNPFNVEPFDIDIEMPQLQILEMSILENISPDFNFNRFPALVSVDAMSTHGLLNADTSKCPELVRLSIDNTNVSDVDVSNNPALRILNISDTRVTELDLSHNPWMQQLYATHYSAMNSDCKLTSLTLANNPLMVYLFLSGNALTSLDCSGMSKLQELVVAYNNLSELNIDGCESLINVDLRGNCLDFNSLPINPGTWNDYLGQQRDMAMPRSVATGHPLDFKSRVVRDDSSTTAAVYSVSRENPSGATLVADDVWSYADGVVTFNKAVSDSVFVEFANPIFQDFTLRTERFKVKAAEDFDKPALAFTFTPVYLGAGEKVAFGVGIDGATADNPKRVHVDFGDGDLKVFDVTTFNGAVTEIDAVKPSYGPVKIYTEADDVVTDVKIENMYLSDVDVTRLEELRHLTLRNLDLYNIDLKWNRCLQSLTLSGNHFATYGLDLQGANGWYGKNVLTHIDLSNNELAEVEFNDVFMLNYLDLSHNNIESFNFKDAESLVYVDMSYNKLANLVINYCCSLREAHFDHNMIESVRMPEENVLEKFSIDNNRLRLSTMPERGNLTEENYIYAPQAVIDIPVKGPGHNLSKEYVVVDGEATVFTWKSTDGATLVEGIDYTIDKGVTNFAESTIGMNLYCELSHPSFPAFSGENVLKTTVINSAGVPSNCLATFVTPVGGQPVRLSMTAARPATAIYIDWAGDGVLTQYIITNETYTVFEAETVKDAQVKVYSYSNVSNLTVFSVTGATMESIDASGMNQLTMFAVNGAGLTSDKIVYPRVGGLTELSLEDNNLTSFDFAPFTKLHFCSLDGNKIKHLDVTGAASTLEVLTASRNQMETVTFGNNNRIWGLSFADNNLTELDLHGVPALYQVILDNNRLSSLDLSFLTELRAVSISGNCFDFSNLPLPQDWAVYNYGNQPMIQIEDGATVDLGYLAEREGVATVFRWYYDVPEYDYDTGELVGEELFENDEYIISEGVTTFLSDIDRVCCVMTNELFPNMYLVTNVIAAKGASGVESVGVSDNTIGVVVDGRVVAVSGVDQGEEVRLVTADGRVVARAAAGSNGSATINAPSAGLYIVSTPHASSKIAVR